MNDPETKIQDAYDAQIHAHPYSHVSCTIVLDIHS